MRKLQDFEIELIRRSATNDDGLTLEATIGWILDNKLTHVSTKTAFALARGGQEVWMYYGDNTDSLLDDIEHEADYYLAPECLDATGKPKTYPEIETIFIVEGEL